MNTNESPTKKEGESCQKKRKSTWDGSLVLCFKPDGQKGQEGEGPVDLIRKRTGDKKSQ
jgi:hypothetical protein